MSIFIVIIFLLNISWLQAFAIQTKQRLASKLHNTEKEFIPAINAEPPLKVLLLVEPTPFNYISGYANRFKEMLRFLKAGGDIVKVVTADSDPNPPNAFIDFPITTQRGFELPIYKQVTCTFDFERSINKIIKSGFKPDLIHVSTPSAIVYPAVLWAKLHNIPLVMSYHTDLVGYAKTYFPYPGSAALAKFLVKIFHHTADLVLCTSPQLRNQMEEIGITRVDVWQKGINTDVFSPKFKCKETRNQLSGGNPDQPLLLYVGRLGFEKRLDRLKSVLDANPTARLAFVGKGPAEEKLREIFKDYPVYFAGEVTGDPLSKAFASSDIFVMPSDTETLGFVVMEALASGVPVVGVAAGGLIDIIDNNVTGFLVSNNDGMLEFSAKVKELIEQRQLRDQFSVAALEWSKSWSWEAATSRLRNIQYRKAISLHRSRDDKGKHMPDIAQAIMKSTYRSR